MNLPLTLLLACFWAFLAFRAFSRGDVSMAVMCIVVGTALTLWRLNKLKGGAK